MWKRFKRAPLPFGRRVRLIVPVRVIVTRVPSVVAAIVVPANVVVIGNPPRPNFTYTMFVATIRRSGSPE